MKGIRFFHTIQYKLIIMYVLLILFAMQLIGIYFMKTMESSFKNNFSTALEQQSTLLAELVVPSLIASEDNVTKEGQSANDPDSGLSNIVNNWYKVSKADIQVIDVNGKVLASSQANAQAIVGQKNTQLMVTRALQNIMENDNENIMIDTDGYRKTFIAKPIVSNGKVIGALYIVAPMEEMYTTIHRINRIFLSGTLIALALTALLGIILSHTITSPIKEITNQVTSIAEGSFDRQLIVLSEDEIGRLSHAFNDMTERLKEALSSNEEERDKLSSILSNMSEGVIATDNAGFIILINHRAKQMLNLDKPVEGMFLQEILLLAEHIDITHLLGGTQTKWMEQGLANHDDTRIRITFTPIHRRHEGVMGTIVVLQDVTEQEKLEQARREFVANVSHELRTPLTTIKSYLEALEDGALEEPELAKRFLGVTRNEAERMIRLVTDLLHLSRLDSKEAALVKEWTSVADMLEEVADRFSFQLQQRSMEIVIMADHLIPKVLIDRDKIDQVLDNLVSNALKYTSDGGKIEMGALQNAQQELEIYVSDNGIGIPKQDLGRIFERFYRVDKARSRNMGGTGLGLSIAQEIVKAHNGVISIASEFKQGTKVSFTLPLQQQRSETP